jgi:hypothetical protein
MIAALENDIADGGRDVLAIGALNAIGELHVAGLDAQASCGGSPAIEGRSRQVPG